MCMYIYFSVHYSKKSTTKNPSRHNNQEILGSTHILYRMQFFQQSRLALTPLKKHGSHTKDMHSQFIKLVYFKVQKKSFCMHACGLVWSTFNNYTTCFIWKKNLKICNDLSEGWCWCKGVSTKHTGTCSVYITLRYGTGKFKDWYKLWK